MNGSHETKCMSHINFCNRDKINSKATCNNVHKRKIIHFRQRGGGLYQQHLASRGNPGCPQVLLIPYQSQHVIGQNIDLNSFI